MFWIKINMFFSPQTLLEIVQVSFKILNIQFIYNIYCLDILEIQEDECHTFIFFIQRDILEF